MSEYIIRPLFNCTCKQFNRRENLALSGLHKHVAVILKTRKARFGLTSSCLCRNIPDVSRFLQRSRDVAENGQTPPDLPLRLFNGLYTPFGSPVIGGQKRYRGTETSSGESNPLKGRPKCGKVVRYGRPLLTTLSGSPVIGREQSSQGEEQEPEPVSTESLPLKGEVR